MIYVIRHGNRDLKIGYTANTDSLAQRVRSLQTGCAYPLRVLATAQGSMRDEKAIHDLLLDWRMHGEWFKPAPFVFRFVDLLKSSSTAGEAVTRYNSRKYADGKRGSKPVGRGRAKIMRSCFDECESDPIDFMARMRSMGIDDVDVMTFLRCHCSSDEMELYEYWHGADFDPYLAFSAYMERGGNTDVGYDFFMRVAHSRRKLALELFCGEIRHYVESVTGSIKRLVDEYNTRVA